MTTFESNIRQIPYKQESVYAMISDLSNIDRFKSRIPADKVEDLTFDKDSIAVKVPMAGSVKLRIVDRIEPSTVKFEAEESPLPFNLWIQVLPVTEASSKMKITLKAELNPFIKGMVATPLKQGIERLADVLQQIKYE